MAKPYDATLNQLIDARPEDWAAFLASRAGVPFGPVVALDTDLSSTLQADKLFRIEGAPPSVLHLELESTGRLGIPVELLRYNAVTYANTGLPVHSVLVLLRPKANATDQTGELIVNGADGRPYLSFRYTVVRVWQETVEALLAAGVGLAPLAVLTNEAAANLRGAIEQLQDRLRAASLPGNVSEELLGAAAALGGLRYDKQRVKEIMMSIHRILDDSSIVQDALERGGIRASHRMLLAQGRKRFGQPATQVEAAIRSITELDRLERMAERIFEAGSWDDLLATP